jgi:transcriptional regulator with XRE-family HTH domain
MSGRPMRSFHSPRYRRFVKRLREAREHAGLTQIDAARALGRPQSFIAKIEAGQRRVDVIELQDLAKVYGKPLGFFVE